MWILILFAICFIFTAIAWSVGTLFTSTGQGTVFEIKKMFKSLFSSSKEGTPTENDDDYNQI